MTIKYHKLLLVAGVIATILGLFLFGNSILEFTQIVHTKAHTVTQTIGIQLSYLIFINAILLCATGIVTIIYRESLKLLNLRVFMGIVSLSWPLFLTITLFFTQFKINIRLLILVLVSLFYVVSVLIVKITNTESSKAIKFNPSAMIAQSGKRAKTVDLNTMMNKNTAKVQHKDFTYVIGQFASRLKSGKTPNFNMQRLLSGKRRRTIRSKNIFTSLLKGKRRRTHFRRR